MQIKILDPAERDLENAYLFYEQRAQGLGTYFLDALYTDIDSLSFFGGIHHKIFGYYRLLSRRFPFAVYYRITDNMIFITAVLDCRQSPSWIRERLMGNK